MQGEPNRLARFKPVPAKRSANDHYWMILENHQIKTRLSQKNWPSLPVNFAITSTVLHYLLSTII
jgi:hypothetical protein